MLDENNKNCIIVNFYPSTFEQENILYNSILSLKDLGYDIILSCNTHVNEKIQSLCTHTIINKKNRLLSVVDGLKNNFNVRPSNYLLSSDGTLEIKYINFMGKSYILGILDSLMSSYGLAKSLGYVNAHFFVGDIILKPNQSDKLKSIEQTYKDWYGYFENRDSKSAYFGVECLYWYSNIDWFINTFLKQKDDSDFISKLTESYYLEAYFGNIIYSTDNIYVHNFIGDEKISFLETDDISNLSTTSAHVGFTLLWDKTKNEFDFLFENMSDDLKTYDVFFTDEYDNTIYHNKFIPPKTYHVDNLKRDYTNKLTVKVIEGSKVLIDYTFDSHCLTRFKEIYSEHSGYKET